MDNSDHSLLEFLILSQCRVREHYLPKLQACLAVLNDGQLWLPIDRTTCHTIGGLILHILEHPRRHAEWIRTRMKPQNSLRFEDFFPASGKAPEDLRCQVDETFNAWDQAMTSLIANVRAGGTLPSGGPGMGAIYHLVEHVSYHLGQVIWATEQLTGHKFDFCQRGINEQALNNVANNMLVSTTD